LIVVSEGVELPGVDDATAERDAFGHRFLKDLSLGPTIAKEVHQRTGFEVRDVVLGHTVRGGSPSLFDRILGTRVGIKAAELVLAGDFGKMVALQGNEVLGVPIEKAVGQQKLVPLDLYETLRTTFNK